MTKVWVFLAHGFEEIEALSVVDFLRRADIEVTTVAVPDTKEVRGSHDISVMTDCTWDAFAPAADDMIVLPGGMPGAKTLATDVRVQQALKDHHEKAGWIAAICAAPIALKAAGILEGKSYTSYPEMREELKGTGTYVEDMVVRDDKLITSRGPATAIHFALMLIEALRGAEVRAEIAEALLLPLTYSSAIQ